MRRFIAVSLLVSLSTLFPSCASIVAPGPDVVLVTNSPSDADIYLDGVHVGKTPARVLVSRDSEGVFRIAKAGYKSAEVDRDKVLNGWFFPGALSWILLWPGVPLSMAVDLAAGNQGKYSTDPLHVVLEPGSSEQVVTFVETGG